MTPLPPEPRSLSRPFTTGGWLMRFSDDELEAIYTAIENAPSRAGYEERWETIIEKVCADRIGPGARPGGAIVFDDALIERAYANLYGSSDRMDDDLREHLVNTLKAVFA